MIEQGDQLGAGEGPLARVGLRVSDVHRGVRVGIDARCRDHEGFGWGEDARVAVSSTAIAGGAASSGRPSGCTEYTDTHARESQKLTKRGGPAGTVMVVTTR